VKSLKEWATVVSALEEGNQTVILRKGGILETTSGFRIESKKFLLFPTYEHQESKHIKGNFQNYLDVIKSNSTKEGYNNIASYAEVLHESDVSKDKLNELSSFHIWSDSYIQERMNWMPEKPMKAIFLKIFKIPKFEIPIKSEYQGCKSWIDINADFQSGNSVLSEEKITILLEKFKEIVK